MSTPTIPAGNLFMNATLWTGDGTTGRLITNGVSGQSFQPDMVWIKERSSTGYHVLDDVNRGAGKILASNDTGAEATDTTAFNAFNTNGFTVGNSGSWYTNRSSQTYVGWNWKAGGTAVSNTAGTITSQVSANTTSGFSIVTFVQGGSTSQTVGHGLGVAPSMIIVKDRTAASQWYVYHQSIGATGGLHLNDTSAVTTTSNFWNNTAPTSSVMTISTNLLGTPGDNIVAYCWAPIAGYSAFGSYTGNGSTDGPFIYTGFRPRWIMIKRTDTSGYGWFIYDTSRSTYNPEILNLNANDSAAETNTGAPNGFDGLSNGFKLRDTSLFWNASGGTYIYAAFAENPFKYANAR